MFHAEENGVGTVLGRDGHSPRIEFQRYEVAPETVVAAKELLLSALS
jgi:hypothetical protein